MNLATIIGILTAISLFLGILIVFYKIFVQIAKIASAISSRERRQDGQIKDTFNIAGLQGQRIKQIEGYLSLPEEERKNRPFYPGSSLAILEDAAVESFNKNKTGGIN